MSSQYFFIEAKIQDQHQITPDGEDDEGYHYLLQLPHQEVAIRNYEEQSQMIDDESQAKQRTSLPCLVDLEQYSTKKDNQIDECYLEDQTSEQLQKQQGKQIDEENQINSEIFKRIIDNKLIGIEPNDQEIQQLNDVQKKIYEDMFEKKKNPNQLQNAKKRVEEKQKFVFKKAFKNIEKKFSDKDKLLKKPIQKKKQRKAKSNENPMEFYNHYFRLTASRMDLAIEDFIHPQKTLKIINNNEKKILKPGFKSFNQSYIKLALQSKSFRNEVEFYLKDRFLIECNSDRQKKINKFLNKCEQIYQESFNEFCESFVKEYEADLNFEWQFKNFVRKKLSDYIINNSKCKIPWGQNELNEALEYARDVINKVNNEIEVEQ